MIFNINSTRGHTGSLLVATIRRAFIWQAEHWRTVDTLQRQHESQHGECQMDVHLEMSILVRGRLPEREREREREREIDREIDRERDRERERDIYI